MFQNNLYSWLCLTVYVFITVFQTGVLAAFSLSLSLSLSLTHLKFLWNYFGFLFRSVFEYSLLIHRECFSLTFKMVTIPNFPGCTIL
jgi:hypothetical protein